MSRRGSVWKLMASNILMKLRSLSTSLSNKLYFCITSYNIKLLEVFMSYGKQEETHRGRH